MTCEFTDVINKEQVFPCIRKEVSDATPNMAFIAHLWMYTFLGKRKYEVTFLRLGSAGSSIEGLAIPRTLEALGFVWGYPATARRRGS